MRATAALVCTAQSAMACPTGTRARHARSKWRRYRMLLFFYPWMMWLVTCHEALWSLLEAAIFAVMHNADLKFSGFKFSFPIECCAAVSIHYSLKLLHNQLHNSTFIFRERAWSCMTNYTFARSHELTHVSTSKSAPRFYSACKLRPKTHTVCSQVSSTADSKQWKPSVGGRKHAQMWQLQCPLFQAGGLQSPGEQRESTAHVFVWGLRVMFWPTKENHAFNKEGFWPLQLLMSSNLVESIHPAFATW